MNWPSSTTHRDGCVTAGAVCPTTTIVVHWQRVKTTRIYSYVSPLSMLQFIVSYVFAFCTHEVEHVMCTVLFHHRVPREMSARVSHKTEWHCVLLLSVKFEMKRSIICNNVQFRGRTKHAGNYKPINGIMVCGRPYCPSTPWVKKKGDTILLSISSPNIDRFS